MCACPQCAETLSEEVLGKMHAPPKNEAVPVIDTHKLPEADGTLCHFERSDMRYHKGSCFDSDCTCRLPLWLSDPVCHLCTPS